MALFHSFFYGWVIFLWVCVCVCVCVCVYIHTRAHVCMILWDPMCYSSPDSSVYGIFQARILKWVAVSSCRDLPDSGIEPGSLMSPALAGGFFTTSTTWEALCVCVCVCVCVCARARVHMHTSVSSLSIHLLDGCLGCFCVMSWLL